MPLLLQLKNLAGKDPPTSTPDPIIIDDFDDVDVTNNKNNQEKTEPKNTISLNCKSVNHHLGINDGSISITLSASNGDNDAGDYTWSCVGRTNGYSDDGDGNGNFTSLDAHGMPPDTYDITATGSDGAKATCSTTISCDKSGVQITIPEGGIDADDGSGTKGEIDPILSGSQIPDYSDITWSISPDPTGNSLKEDGTDVTFENLTAQDYTIKIDDIYGCTVSKNVTVPLNNCIDHGYSFKYFDDAKVQSEVTDRDSDDGGDPTLIDQNNTGLCGMACLAYYLAKNKPAYYKNMVSELLQSGSTTTPTGEEIYATEPLKNVCPKKSNYPNNNKPMPQADCILLSSLKNTYRNRVFNFGVNYYDPTDLTTDPSTGDDELKHEMRDWLGMTITHDEIIHSLTYSYYNITDPTPILKRMSDDVKVGKTVIIKCFTNLIRPQTDLETHLAVFNGNFSFNANNRTVSFDVICWGANNKVKNISYENFLTGTFGYISAQ